MSYRKTGKKHNVLVTLAIVLSLIGIISINVLFQFQLRFLIDERDDQLFSLAYSVDGNLIQKMEELSHEMDFILRKKDYRELEEEFSREYDAAILNDFFSNSHLFEKTSLEGVLVTDQQMHQVYTLNQNDRSNNYFYTFINQDYSQDFFICYDQYGKYSVALKNRSHDGKLLYYVLIDLNHFYDSIVSENLRESHWVVFYEQDCGLLLQNHDNQDAWMVLTEQEIRDRQDGYSIILENQLQNTKGAETYMYSNYHGKTVHNRIVTLPQKMTQNGYFTIGITRDSELLYSKLYLSRNLMLVFMLLLIISGILITRYVSVYRHRMLAEQMALQARAKEKELREALEQAQFRNSMRQLQPHFLYNALSSIREIVLESPEYAAELLLDFTNFLRACILAMSNKDLIPFEQELKNIEAYVNIEKMRLGDKLTVIYDIQEKDFEIIPLGVQPLVENAIRHGISKKRNKTGTVWISTRRTEEYIEICVQDNGIGFDVDATVADIESGKNDSTGIKNLVFRYEYTLNAKLEGTSVVGEGTVSRIRIPVTR